MSDQTLNADFGAYAVKHTAAMDWTASPSPSVWRKRLDLAGATEASRVTSVVRYDPDSRFPSHPHPEGEEILVLEGVFSDQHGDYPAGSFLLNPEGFSHAPFSTTGCVLFVKLRQYPGQERRRIAIDTDTASWHAGSGPVSTLSLYAEAGYRETIRLLRMRDAAALPEQDYPGGAEIFVIEGAVHDGGRAYVAGSWARYPPSSRFALRTESGARIYLKSGHLAG